jgi:hypothetical protein
VTDKGTIWLDRSIKIGAILTALWTLAAYGIPLAGMPTRVEALEEVQPALLYMSCVSFGEKHPANEIPAACSKATRR